MRGDARVRDLRVARVRRAGVAALAADPGRRRFAGRVLTARQLADEYGVTDVDGSRADCWGLIADHGWDDQEPGVIARYR